MPHLLPGDGGSPLAHAVTPREIVAELDKYVVGQAKAKRAVAIALRNRYRRQRLPKDMAEEVAFLNALHEAEQDIEAGRVISDEQMRQRIAKFR